MKCTVVVLAVLLLVTGVAIGQQSQSSFPMAANPSLATDTSAETSPIVEVDRHHELPSSMAVNQASTTTELSPSVVGYTGDNESSFPAAANPSITTSTTSETSISVVERRHNESSFPAEANPSR
jgi:cytoskeletal protein RodZ